MEEPERVEPFEDEGPKEEFVEVVRHYFDNQEGLTDNFEDAGYSDYAEEQEERIERLKQERGGLDSVLGEEIRDRVEEAERDRPETTSLTYYTEDYPFKINLNIRAAYPPVEGEIRDISSLGPMENPYFTLLGGAGEGILGEFYGNRPKVYTWVLKEAMGRRAYRSPESCISESEELNRGKMAKIEVPKSYEPKDLEGLTQNTVEVSKWLFDHFREIYRDKGIERLEKMSDLVLVEGKDDIDLQELEEKAEGLLETIRDRKED